MKYNCNIYYIVGQTSLIIIAIYIVILQYIYCRAFEILQYMKQYVTNREFINVNYFLDLDRNPSIDDAPKYRSTVLGHNE